jgi:hypothetical protein
MNHRARRAGRVTGLILAAGSLLAPPAAAGATGPACGAGKLVSSPTVGGYDALYGIAAVSPGDVWAVGRYIENNSRNISRALVEHWDGTRWQVVTVPQPAAHNAYLFAVTASSAADVWAVGDTSNSRYLDDRTLIEHWDGSAWHIVPTPAAGDLRAVAASSASDVWAVGVIPAAGGSKARALTEHWDGTRWQVVPSPSPGRYGDGLAGVSVAGPGSAWAVGSAVTSKFDSSAAFTEHWNGTTWSAVPAPGPGIDSELRAVTSAGGNDAWAVGLYDVESPTGTLTFTLAEHWNGTHWVTVPSPMPTGDDVFEGVAAVSANDIWAVGAQGRRPPLVARWNGHAWAQVTAPYQREALNGLSAVSAPSATDVWAGGGYISLRNYSDHTLVEDLCPAAS